MVKIATLKRRADFLRVRGGGRWSGHSFVLEAKARAAGSAVSGPRFGLTVTKKLGNAVVRNRIRRRLKAVLQQVAGDAALDHDYVVIARAPAVDHAFEDLKADMVRALARVVAGRREAKTARE